MFCLYFFLPLGLARVLYPDKATEQKFEEGIDQKMKSKMHSIVAKIPSFDLPPTQVANPSGISLASEPSSASGPLDIPLDISSSVGDQHGHASTLVMPKSSGDDESHAEANVGSEFSDLLSNLHEHVHNVHSSVHDVLSDSLGRVHDVLSNSLRHPDSGHQSSDSAGEEETDSHTPTTAL